MICKGSTVLILIVVSQLIACTYTAPVDEINEVFYGAQNDDLGNSEVLSQFDGGLSGDQSHELNEIQNEGEEKQPQRKLAFYWQHLTMGVRKTLAPTLEYVNLLNRYHSWYRRYTAIEKVTGGNIKRAIQVMREEYAKANELLMEENCPLDKTERDYESMDFVYRTLKVVIIDLERILHKLEEKKLVDSDGQVSYSVALSEDSDGIDEETINRAMDRVKRTAVKTAKDVLKTEALVLAKMVAVNAATFYLQGAFAESAIDSLGYLAPLVGMLSSGDISLASAYLRDLELRVALGVFQRMNPIPKLRCDSGNGKEKSD